MKKVSIIFAAVIASLLLCPALAHARASEYIGGYTVEVSEGDTQGTVIFGFLIRAKEPVAKIGALEIRIYEANGDCVSTICGNTSNGLLSSKRCLSYGSTYSYKGTPGTSYYAVVTLCAGPATNYDTRKVTTEAVRAPY